MYLLQLSGSACHQTKSINTSAKLMLKLDYRQCSLCSIACVILGRCDDESGLCLAANLLLAIFKQPCLFFSIEIT